MLFPLVCMSFFFHLKHVCMYMHLFSLFWYIQWLISTRIRRHLYILLILLMLYSSCLRWLDVGVAHLTSAPCWVIYLQVLQEAVWPGGTLPAQPRPERSAAERGETKEQCLNCLIQLLPGMLQLLNLDHSCLNAILIFKAAEAMLSLSACFVPGQSSSLTCWEVRSTD